MKKTQPRNEYDRLQAFILRKQDEGLSYAEIADVAVTFPEWRVLLHHPRPMNSHYGIIIPPPDALCRAVCHGFHPSLLMIPTSAILTDMGITMEEFEMRWRRYLGLDVYFTMTKLQKEYLYALYENPAKVLGFRI